MFVTVKGTVRELTPERLQERQDLVVNLANLKEGCAAFTANDAKSPASARIDEVLAKDTDLTPEDVRRIRLGEAHMGRYYQVGFEKISRLDCRILGDCAEMWSHEDGPKAGEAEWKERLLERQRGQEPLSLAKVTIGSSGVSIKSANGATTEIVPPAAGPEAYQLTAGPGLVAIERKKSK